MIRKKTYWIDDWGRVPASLGKQCHYCAEYGNGRVAAFQSPLVPLLTHSYVQIVKLYAVALALK